MADVLVVPIRLDALCLPVATAMVEPLADFSRLPYVDPDSGRDTNSDTAYVSEDLLSTPFDDQNLWLKPGVHLHWALPDGLTRLVQRDGGTQVPEVPNRWLVTRTKGGRPEARWVVDSDYLAAPGDAGSGVTYPVDRPVPYGLLGRTLPYTAWLAAPDGPRIGSLTAIGYGEPTFAAFYPNCMSVFGLHDPAFTAVPDPDIGYEVLGWWSDPAKDPAGSLTLPDPLHPAATTWADLLGARYGWSPPADALRPSRTVCHASITFRPEPAAPDPADGEAGVWIGNTATEALAAHLGAVLPDLEPDEVENLLEALSYADELEAKPLDVGPALAAARHGGTFRAVPSGALWTVRREDLPGQATTEQRQRREALRLGHAEGDLLNALNEAQDLVERAGQELVSLREQLFADWYKYQLCVYPYETTRDSYPDPDEVRNYLERHIQSITDRTAGLTGLEAARDQARSALGTAIDTVNASIAGSAAARFVVDQVAAPQYYLPVEPVVLFTGDIAAPTERHGQDGVLACAVVTGPDPVEVRALPDLNEAAFGTGLGREVWRADPWNPIMLQWEVEFYPADFGDNLDSGDRNYSASYITDNYALRPGNPDLVPSRDVPDRGANTYTGMTVLSSSARPVLAARILRYLAGGVVDAYNTAHETHVDPDGFQDDPTAILEWYAANGDDHRLHTLVAIYQHLHAHEGGNLSQVLGGFNDALLMRRLTRQLPIADPLGFPAYQDFAGRVARAVGDDTRHAPHPLSDFNPIRAGSLRVNRLRLVDTFGQVYDVPVEGLATTSRLRVPGHPTWIAMPPRLVQPTRLSFRWLDSDHDLREMNDVPATSPVCGWLLADPLDDGLAVFDADGARLGVLAARPDPSDPARARWSGAATIGNPHLAEVLDGLGGLGADGLAGFLDTLDTALTGIEPDDFAQGPLTAVPLAVVRAELDLQAIGLPAVHQDWNVFRQDLRRTSRDSDAYPLVRFPVAVGAADLLGDGLVGYWDGTFRPATGHPVIELALDRPARRLTMLLDPRAPVHATCGVLPVKALSIPAEQYRTALDAIAPMFFTAPVLVPDPAKPNIPLPDPGEQVWVWQEQAVSGLREIELDDLRPDASIPARPALREGWLTLKRP